MEVKEERSVYSYEEVFSKTKKYFNNDELAANVWINKYALKDLKGNILELDPSDMHRRIAKELARIEAKYPNPLSEEKIFSLIDKFKFLIPQGSPMTGIGNPYQISSLSNCFVIGNKTKADSYGGIMKLDQKLVQLMKRRAGVGADLSFIRPSGTTVKNSARFASGVETFMNRFSNSTREVGQSGRKGALMLTIDIQHPDAEAFIDAKKDKTKVTGANISIKIRDEFMEANLSGKDYTQMFDFEGKIIKKEIDAKKLWDKIINNAWEDAEPGVLFWDTIIRESVADCYWDLGFLTICVNPCGEITLCANDSCRLLAINLYNFVKNCFKENAEFDFDLFKEYAGYAQRIMDDIIDLELECIDKIINKILTDPEEEEFKLVELELWRDIKDICTKGRRTGTGITAEGDMLAALGLRYGTDEANNFAEKVHKELKLSCFRSSVQLAKERGKFPIYDHKREENNPFISRIREEDPELYNDMVIHGRRNIALLTIAPTGTVSLMSQTTSGIEPAFMISYRRRKKLNANDTISRVDFIDEIGDKWEESNVFHHKFKDYLIAKGFTDERIEDLSDDEIKELVEESPYHKATSNDVDWIKKVEMQGRIQKHVDHSISVTVNLPSDVTRELVNDVYVTAWRSGCKGCTIYRDGSRSGVLISAENKKQSEQDTVYKENHAPRRPKELKCNVHRFRNGGQQWIGFVGVLDDRPYEIFTGIIDEIKLPFTIKEGYLLKSKLDGKNKYDFVGMGGAIEYKIEWVNKIFNEEYWNYGRLFSGILRHGMPLQNVVDLINTLKLDGDHISTWKAGVARMIKAYIKDGTKVNGKLCPDCKTEALAYKEGCLTCESCGSSKCS